MSPATLLVLLFLALIVYASFHPTAVPPPLQPTTNYPSTSLAAFEALPTVSATALRPVAIVAPYGAQPWGVRRPLDRFRGSGLYWIWADDPNRFDLQSGRVRGPEPVTLSKVIENESDADFTAELAAQCDNAAEIWFNDAPVAGGADWSVPIRATVTVRRGHNVLRARVRNFELGWGAGGFACAFWQEGTPAPLVVTDSSWGWEAE